MTNVKRTRSRKWRRFAIGSLVVVLGYYGLNVFAVISAAHRDEERRVDAIVVLGAAQYNGVPSPQLAARLDHAADLYARGDADWLMVTGGKRPGDVYTEAQASATYLKSLGVPDEAILEENQGTNTFNSLQHAASVLADEGLTTVLLVTDPFHALRSVLIAREVGLTPFSSPTPTSVYGPGKQLRRELVEAGGVAVGRVIGFGRLSRITG